MHQVNKIQLEAFLVITQAHVSNNESYEQDMGIWELPFNIVSQKGDHTPVPVYLLYCHNCLTHLFISISLFTMFFLNYAGVSVVDAKIHPSLTCAFNPSIKCYRIYLLHANRVQSCKHTSLKQC